MTMKATRGRQAYTRFMLVGTIIDTQQMVDGFYNDLVNLYETAKETGDRSSPFYDWELKRENINVRIDFGYEGLSIVLSPEFASDIDYDDLYYDLGGSYYLATIEDVGGSPSYNEFIKVIAHLLKPIKDKVGWIDYSEVKEYCGEGKGFIILTEDASPYKPLRAEMKAMGLVTPTDLLERMSD